MDLIVLTFCILMIYGIRINKEGYYSDCYSKEYWNCLKGVFAIAIILHHLSQKITDGFLFRQFQEVGFLCVAAFFFISGYGLMKQYRVNQERYLKHFFRNRIMVILLQYVVISIAYWLIRSVLGDRRSIKEFVLSFLNGTPITPYSWYIIEILMLYVIFYLACIFSKGSYRKLIAQIGICLILFTIVSHAVGYYFYWYNTWGTFILGIVVASLQEKPTRIDQINYRYQICSLGLIFIILYVTAIHLKSASVVVQVLLYQVTSISFVGFLLLISKKVQVHNHSLKWLGERSFELYMLQGLPLLLFRSNLIYIENDFLFGILTLFTTIFLSYPYHEFNRFLARKLRNDRIIFSQK